MAPAPEKSPSIYPQLSVGVPVSPLGTIWFQLTHLRPSPCLSVGRLVAVDGVFLDPLSALNVARQETRVGGNAG